MGRSWGIAVFFLGLLVPWIPLSETASTSTSVCLRAAACPPWPGSVEVSLGARVAPNVLPAKDYAPVTWTVSGKFGKADGGHPPALREAVIDIDKDVKVSAKGYPVCKTGRRQLDNRNPAGAVKACGDSVLGKGLVRFGIAFPEQNPIEIPSPLTVFNGGEKGGGITLYLHTFIAVPTPSAVVTVVTITRRGSGIRSVAEVPVVAGGSGSVLDFRFKLGKTFSYRGRKVGFFEAKCPDDVFKISVANLLFENEAQTPGEAASTKLKGSLAVPCIGKG